MKNRLLLSLMAVIGLFPSNLLAQAPTIRVDTVAAMVAWPIPTVNSKLSAFVAGRDALGDGGGGVFYYNAADASATNTTYIFKPTSSNGRWVKERGSITDQRWAAPAAAAAIGLGTGGTDLSTGGIWFGSSAAAITSITDPIIVSGAAGQPFRVNLTTTGDFLVNTNHLVVDTSTKFVGIGTNVPQNVLHITGASTAGTRLIIQNTDTGGTSWDLGSLGSAGSTDGFFAITDLVDHRMVISGAGNIGFGTTTFGTSAAKVIALGNGTAPSTSPADAVQMWSSDIYGVAGAAGLTIRNEGGATIGFGQTYNILAQSTTADATLKTLNVSSLHYTSADEPFILIRGVAGVTTNSLDIGGGTVSGNAATSIRFFTAANNTTVTGTEMAGITSDGRLYGTALHNNGGAVTGTTSQYIASGTYTPTLTSVANVSASGAYVLQWMRVGNVVTVGGRVDVDPATTLTLTQLGVSLPIASGITDVSQAGGHGNGRAQLSSAMILGDVANDRAQMEWTPTDVSSQSMSLSFIYLIQ